MKRYVVGLLLLAVTVICGCLPSVQPFYTEASKTELPWVEGEWLQLGEDGAVKEDRPWVFKGDAIHALDDDGRRAKLEATYFSVNKITYVDTMTEADAVPGSDWVKMHLLPIQVAKVQRFGNRLVLTPMDFEWINKAVKSGEVKLPHTMLDGSVVFTCTPEDWEKFLAQYGSDTNVFSGEVRYSFSKVEPPPEPEEAEEAPPAAEGKPAE